MKKTALTVIVLIAFSITLIAQKKSGAIQFQTSFNPIVMAEANGLTLLYGRKVPSLRWKVKAQVP